MAPSSNSKPTVAHALLSRAHSPTTTTRILSEKIASRPLHLKPTSPTPNARTQRHQARLLRESQKRRKQKPPPLSARDKRALAIYDIPKSEQVYAIYAPLHRMWLSYIREVLGLPSCMPVGGAAAAKLVSADFHGAELEVVRSRCVSRVGVRGIVVKDSKFVFEVVTRGNAVRVLPKEHTVFRFEVPPSEQVEGQDGQGDGAEAGTERTKNLVFELHGEQFQYRAVDRANKKFKPHHLPDL